MSIKSREASQTVFEQIWGKPDGHIFKSARFGVMAVADAFAKFPYQVVVAPKDGSAGEAVRFSDLSRHTKRTLHEVADAVEEKIAAQCGDTERVITHTEGFGVPDHAHIVLFAAERKQGEALYTGSPLGQLAVQNTLDVITFTPIEHRLLEARLEEIR
ncbi:MAG: hypothetical protein ACQR33_02125 [Candidatus Saccharibacteria bacterium]